MSDSQFIIEFHKKRQEWMKMLDFYHEELAILQKELFKTLEAHPDLPSIIEHFQEYRTIIKKKVDIIDDLKFRLLLSEKMSDPNDTVPLREQYQRFQSEVSDFEEKITELKQHLRRFIAKNMK